MGRKFFSYIGEAPCQECGVFPPVLGFDGTTTGAVRKLYASLLDRSSTSAPLGFGKLLGKGTTTVLSLDSKCGGNRKIRRICLSIALHTASYDTFDHASLSNYIYIYIYFQR